MELMQDVKGYSEEEEEEELAAESIVRREESSRLQGASNLMNRRKPEQLELMELSLGSNKKEDIEGNLEGIGSSSSYCMKKEGDVEKEHMFDKVVTPSDVGKLNRLVIPKQHAEKYFPLDSSANEKGLLLNFEDRNGKLWRFRYSYWNSSQSYVMTKGWSRFVKDKKLDAGDVVSFQRGLADSHRHRLYIDFRRRPHHHVHVHPSPTPFITPLFLPNHPTPHYSITWATSPTARLYSLPSPNVNTPSANGNIVDMYAFHREQHQHHRVTNNNLYNNDMNPGSGSVYFLRSMADHHQQRDRGDINVSPMIIDSVPVAHHHRHQHLGDKSEGATATTSTAGKRLRLFGVNMECASNSSTPEESSTDHVTMANSLVISNSSSLQPPEEPGEQRGAASVFFDLDPSLRYRQ